MHSPKPIKIESKSIYINTSRAIVMSLLLLFLLQPDRANAQLSGAPTFSPYTMYGLGDMAIGGSSFNRSMGGVGVAFREFSNFNYLNPASLSAMRPRTALFNFGGEGQNIYSRSANTSTSYNSFNIHDLGLAVPLAKGIALGFSMNPISSVGYATQIVDTTKSITDNIGRTVYDYSGDGGITQISASLGVRVFRGLSLGASLHYWFGTLDRRYTAQVSPYFTNDSYRTIMSFNTMRLSKVLYSFGIQYAIPMGKDKENFLSIGATFQPRFRANTINNTEVASTNGSSVDTISMGRTDRMMTIPMKIAAGVFFHSERFGVGFDYTRQDWDGTLSIPTDQRVTLGAQQDFKVGAQFTPSRYDVRSAMKRWTYKVGARYSTGYLLKDGYTMHDMAVTLGADIPLRKFNPSKVGVGVELGTRGTVTQGQIRENYFKVFVALSFFADDWFVRYKYN